MFFAAGVLLLNLRTTPVNRLNAVVYPYLTVSKCGLKVKTAQTGITYTFAVRLLYAVGTL